MTISSSGSYHARYMHVRIAVARRRSMHEYFQQPFLGLRKNLLTRIPLQNNFSCEIWSNIVTLYRHLYRRKFFMRYVSNFISCSSGSRVTPEISPYWAIRSWPKYNSNFQDCHRIGFTNTSGSVINTIVVPIWITSLTKSAYILRKVTLFPLCRASIPYGKGICHYSRLVIVFVRISYVYVIPGNRLAITSTRYWNRYAVLWNLRFPMTYILYYFMIDSLLQRWCLYLKWYTRYLDLQIVRPRVRYVSVYPLAIKSKVFFDSSDITETEWYQHLVFCSFLTMFISSKSFRTTTISWSSIWST